MNLNLKFAYLQSNTVSEDEVKCMLIEFGSDVLHKIWSWHLPFIWYICVGNLSSNITTLIMIP